MLDFSDEVLASLDFVVASIHSQFNLSRAEQTQILIGAVREQQEAVAATLSETYRLLEQVRKACSLMC